MGFLSRLFGQPSPQCKQDIPLAGGGNFSVQVVGESHYQENLKQICAGYNEEGKVLITNAKLVHADDNPYDNQAIRVEISGLPVGHLSRSEARYYRNRMRAKGHAGLSATSKAKISGGWDRSSNDVGYFGVTLDLPTEFIESIIEFPANNTVGHTSETDNFFFDVEKCQRDELAKCEVGDYVNLWVPKSDSQQVHIFRRGSIGGTGRMGFVPSTYSHIIASHLHKGLEYETEIVEIDKSHCKIKCKFISQEETTANRAAQAETAAKDLKAELQKKYTPKQPLSIRVRLPKNHKLELGQELFLAKQPLEYYVQNALRLQLNFIDKNGTVVAQKDNEPRLIRTVLRASFSQLPMTLRIVHIETPDKRMLDYLDRIEAKVEVSFEKQPDP